MAGAQAVSRLKRLKDAKDPNSPGQKGGELFKVRSFEGLSAFPHYIRVVYSQGQHLERLVVSIIIHDIHINFRHGGDVFGFICQQDYVRYPRSILI